MNGQYTCVNITDRPLQYEYPSINSSSVKFNICIKLHFGYKDNVQNVSILSGLFSINNR